MQGIIDQLRGINPLERTNEIERELKTEKNPRKLDSLVKEYKILKSIIADDLTPVTAFTRDTVAVIPSHFRSPTEMDSGAIQLPDINLLLRDIGISNNTLLKAQKVLPDDQLSDLRKNLYASVEQLSGFEDPTLNRDITKNPFREIAGDQPKKGFFQRKMVRKKQDLSARSVITPDPTLDIDDVTIPYDLGLKVYEPFIKKEMFSMGYRSAEIEKALIDKSDLAKSVIRKIGKDRPIILNRAPSIWQSSITAHNPIFTEDKTIGVPHIFDGFQLADHDGDKVALHVPVSAKAVEDAKKMMMSNNLIWEGTGAFVSAPEHASSVGLYRLSKTPEGLAKINKLLPEAFHITKKTDKKEFYSILKEVEKTQEHDTGTIVTKLRQLGDLTAYETGFTIGLSDLTPLKKERASIIDSIKKDIHSAQKDGITQEKLNNIYMKGVNKLTTKVLTHYEGLDNPIGELLFSKARGSASQYRDLIATPIALLGGELTEKPILHSYSEGLTPTEYWQAESGARKGIIGRSQDTAMPGALAVEILASSNQVVISDSKDRPNSVSLLIDNIDDVIDRIAAKTISGVITEGGAVTASTIQKLKSKGIHELEVFTPLGSTDDHGGLPMDAYGVTKNGIAPEVGMNVGIVSAHTLVHPLFTGSMKSFHTGSSMSDESSGYPRIKQILGLPKQLPKQATLAEESGKVNKIIKDDLGGHRVLINNTSHYISPNNRLLVSKGQKIERGEILSSGPVQPKQLAELVSLDAAQNYMVNELKKQVPSARRRALEVVVESITRFGQITDSGDSDMLYGDVLLLSKIKKNNEKLVNKAKFEIVFKGTNTLPQVTQDWLTQLNFRNIKRTLSKNVQEGAEASIHSYSIIPGIVAGTEFGEGNHGQY